MASYKNIVHIIGTGLFIYAWLLMCTSARPSGSSAAALHNAEKLLTEALKKEIDDALSEPLSRSESTRDSPDADVFAEVLEEAVKGIENNYADGKRNAAKFDKAIGYGKAQMAGKLFKGSKVAGKAKIGIDAHRQKKKEGKNKNKNTSRFQSEEMTTPALDVPVRYDLSELRLHNSAKQGSLRKSQFGNAFEVAKLKETPSHKSRQSIYSNKDAKAEISAHSDDDIASKISEFYKILEDYAEENHMQTKPAHEALSVAERQQVLPLDQPIKLNSNGDGYKEKGTWSQKRTESSQKLAAEIEKLAAKLKQAEHDSLDDEFPSLSQWFWHHRGIRKSKHRDYAADYAAVYEHPGSNHNEEDDIFRTGDKQDSEMNYPWSKYFREIQDAAHSNKQKRKRDYKGSDDEERFMNEIEARVAELQQQLGANRRRNKIPKLRM